MRFDLVAQSGAREVRYSNGGYLFNSSMNDEGRRNDEVLMKEEKIQAAIEACFKQTSFIWRVSWANSLLPQGRMNKAR